VAAKNRDFLAKTAQMAKMAKLLPWGGAEDLPRVGKIAKLLPRA